MSRIVVAAALGWLAAPAIARADHEHTAMMARDRAEATSPASPATRSPFAAWSTPRYGSRRQ